MKKFNWLESLKGKFSMAPKKRRHLGRLSKAESLEDRTLLSSIKFTGGRIRLTAGAGQVNNIELTDDGATLTISDSSGLPIHGSLTTRGWVQVDANTIEGPSNTTTRAVQIFAGDMDDTITVNSFTTGGAAMQLDGQAGTDTITISDDVTGQTGDTIQLFAETINLDADVASTSRPIQITGAVTLGADVSLSAANSTITITGDVDSDGTARDLDLNGGSQIITVNGIIGAGSAIDVFSTSATNRSEVSSVFANSVDIDGAVHLSAGIIQANTGTIDIEGPVTLLGAQQLTTLNNQDITIGNSVAGGGNALSASAGTGDVNFNGDLNSVGFVTSTATETTFGGGVSAQGVNVIGDGVVESNITTTLGGISVSGDLDANGGNILFAPNFSSVMIGGNVTSDGNDFSIRASSGMLGLTSVGGDVTGVDTLEIVGNGALSATFGGLIDANEVGLNATMIQLGGDVTAQVGSVAITGNVTLTGDTVIRSGLGVADNVTVTGTIDGAGHSATLNAGSGAVSVMGAAIGGGGALDSFSARGINVMVPDVTVDNNISLIGDTISFGTLTGSGIASITTFTAGSTIVIDGTGGDLDLPAGELAKFTDGFSKVVFGDALSGDVTIPVASTFNDTIEINSAGTITIGGDLVAGGVGNLASVLLNGNTDLTGDITTTGGRVRVIGDLALNTPTTIDNTGAGAVATGGRFDVSGAITGGNDLTVNAGIGGASIVEIGGAIAAGDITVNASNRTVFGGDVTAGGFVDVTSGKVRAGNISASNDINIDGRLELTSNATLAGAFLDVSGSVSSFGGNFDLTINSTSDAVGDFTEFGGTVSVGALNVTDNAGIVFSAAVTADSITASSTGGIDVASNLRAKTGGISLTGPVELNGGNAIFHTTGGDVAVNGALTATAGQNLEVRANNSSTPVGAATFQAIDGVGFLRVIADTLNLGGVIGGTTALGELQLKADAITIANDVTVDGDIFARSVAGDVTVDNGVTVTSDNGDLTLIASGAVNNNGTLSAPNGTVTP